MSEVRWCPAIQPWGKCRGEMRHVGSAQHDFQLWDDWKCASCGYVLHEPGAAQAISHAEAPRHSTIRPPPPECRLCGRAGVVARGCKALTCARCGVWVLSDNCGAAHPLPMTPGELREDVEETTQPMERRTG